MKGNKLKLIAIILASILLTSCAEDTAMHITGENYLHKDSTDERTVNVIENQIGLASLGKNTKNYNAYFLARTSLTKFSEATGTLGASEGGSDSIFQQEGYLYFPLDSAVYRSQYGWRYLRGSADYHTGDDFSVPEGTPVYASLDGKVVRDGLDMDKCTTGGGCNITIEGKLGSKIVRVAYLHLKQPTKFNYGDSVKAGQVIATSGNTGNSTGAHLHVEVMIQETYTAVGLSANRPIVTSMLSANDLKGAKDEWWWDVPLSWSRVKPSSYFKETEGVKASGQTISRISSTENAN